MKPTLVGGVGYRNLTDMSIGPMVMEELKSEPWPDHIDVEDLSVGPVAVTHWLEGRDPRYERVVVITAAGRGSPPASLRCYQWDRVLPPADEVQDRVAEAVTGVIDGDNLLVVTRQFGALPEEVFVIEVEPVAEAFGLELTPAVKARVPEVKKLARRLAERGASDVDCPVTGLGGHPRFEASSRGGGEDMTCLS